MRSNSGSAVIHKPCTLNRNAVVHTNKLHLESPWSGRCIDGQRKKDLLTSLKRQNDPWDQMRDYILKHCLVFENKHGYWCFISSHIHSIQVTTCLCDFCDLSHLTSSNLMSYSFCSGTSSISRLLYPSICGGMVPNLHSIQEGRCNKCIQQQ